MSSLLRIVPHQGTSRLLRVFSDWTSFFPIIAWAIEIHDPEEHIENYGAFPISVESCPLNAIEIIVLPDGRCLRPEECEYETVGEAIRECQAELAARVK